MVALLVLSLAAQADVWWSPLHEPDNTYKVIWSGEVIDRSRLRIGFYTYTFHFEEGGGVERVHAAHRDGRGKNCLSIACQVTEKETHQILYNDLQGLNNANAFCNELKKAYEEK